MARCLLALGSNLGNPGENLSRASGEVASLPGCQLIARSRWHETTPIGGPSGQGDFLNGSLLVETRLEPLELSRALHDVERRLGRQRVVRWDARVIDIDLLLYDHTRIESPELTVPHPRMSFRRFVLEPACDIAGALVDPTSGWTLAQLLRHLITAPRYAAVTASQPEHARQLADEICRTLGCPRLEDLLPAVGNGADSPRAKGVEWGASISEAAWRQVPALVSRLPRQSESELPPVVSGYWVEPAGLGQVRPAVVIAWDGSDNAATVSKFRQTLDQPGHGPLARIVGNDFSAAVSEAVAAIRAVWPKLPPGKAA